VTVVTNVLYANKCQSGGDKMLSRRLAPAEEGLISAVFVISRFFVSEQ